jgi:hypothetical protein
MTGLETMALLKLLAQGQENTGGPRLPFDDLARIIRKLDAVLERRELSVAGEESLTNAERRWLMGDTVDAVMLHAKARGVDPVLALNELKELHGSVPVVGALERRVDAILVAEGINWEGSD